MRAKTVIITGGNANLGYACAKAIAQRGTWQIILAVRSSVRGEEAAARLKAETAYEHIDAMPLDLASLDSIRDFVETFSGRDLPPLHAVVCNAGVQTSTTTQVTADGFELTFGVNHLGHFLLINLLLEHLATTSRIVVVSSGTHRNPQGRMERFMGMAPPHYTSAYELAYPQPLTHERVTYIGKMRYATSKLCNVLFTYELARRLQAHGQSDITVNAFDPGLMPGTGLARDYGAVQRFFWNNILPIFRDRLPEVHSPQASGHALARLATDPTVPLVSGRYYVGLHEQPSSAESYSRQKATDLWETSQELVGLPANLLPLPHAQHM